ncbi:MAG TPA: DUF2231 domain-containing protein [Blastocatellia bacterium]|nr:DUF2231 domain-containing protein [Blastocatellia bacterium]
MFSWISGWDALHPLVIHFPIALLLTAPVLLVTGLLWPKNSRGLFIAALVLMALGTIGTYVAISTGSAGEEMAERIPGAEAILERHEELAETTRTIFTALTLIFTAILFAPRLMKKELGRKTAAVVTSAFLIFYLAGAVVLARTAHQGGRLVHELGVRASINSGASGAQAAAPEQNETQSKAEKKDKDDDD